LGQHLRQRFSFFDPLLQDLSDAFSGRAAIDQHLQLLVVEGGFELVRVLSRLAKVGVVQFAGETAFAATSQEEALRVDRVEPGLAPTVLQRMAIPFNLGPTGHIPLEPVIAVILATDGARNLVTSTNLLNFLFGKHVRCPLNPYVCSIEHSCYQTPRQRAKKARGRLPAPSNFLRQSVLSQLLCAVLPAEPGGPSPCSSASTSRTRVRNFEIRSSTSSIDRINSSSITSVVAIFLPCGKKRGRNHVGLW